MASEVQNFYKNKYIFLTGGTGFLGVAIIEKILRSAPEVSNDQSYNVHRKKGFLIKSATCTRSSSFSPLEKIVDQRINAY